MKTIMRISMMVVAVMIGVLGFGAAAQAYISTEQDYMVAFRPNITREQALAEVAAWGSGYQLADITSREEQRYVKTLLKGLGKGDYWIGGYENVGKIQNALLKAFRNFPPGVKGESVSSLGEYYPAMSNRKGNNAFRYYNVENPRYISGFLVERSLADVNPVPIPSAVLLLGSGMTMLGGLRMARRKEGKSQKTGRGLSPSV